MVVKLRHSFERGELDGLPGFPGCWAMNQLSLVQAVDGLSQGVVVTFALAAHRWFNSCLRQPLGVTDADVLRPPFGVTDQTTITLGLLGVQGLLETPRRFGLHGNQQPRCSDSDVNSPRFASNRWPHPASSSVPAVAGCPDSAEIRFA